MTKTNRIAGHRLTLTAGVRYIASRPFASRGRKIYPVMISPMRPEDWTGIRPTIVDGLNYLDADNLVNAFNNGVTSFDGRVW